MKRSSGPAGPSFIPKSQPIPQNLAALNPINGCLAEPAAAAELAADLIAALRNGLVDLLAQVEITAHALRIAAINPEQRPGVLEVKRVFHLTAARQTYRVIVPEIQTQGLQLGEFVGQRRRVADALLLLDTVFGARVHFL